jgi:hypothetical protein
MAESKHLIDSITFCPAFSRQTLGTIWDPVKMNSAELYFLVKCMMKKGAQIYRIEGIYTHATLTRVLLIHNSDNLSSTRSGPDQILIDATGVHFIVVIRPRQPRPPYRFH